MSLTEITGDIFATPGLEALAHGVNTVGVMGAGIAVHFRDLWPEMFAEYQHRCAAGLLPLGGFMGWHIPEGARGRLTSRPRWIYNLATQPRPGPCASLLAIKSALDNMLACSRGARVKRIGICRVGTGYGGLRWEDVRPLIERAARDVDIVVVSLPEKTR